MGAFEKPIATVDVALFTVSEGRLCVMLAKRPDDSEIFPGVFALPGGYIHVSEDDDAEACARRVLRGKAGLRAPYLEQLCTFSGKFRDPRAWSLSVAYYAVMPATDLVGTGLRLAPVDEIPALPFDHNQIVATASRRLRGKASYSSLPTFLLPEKFTFDELHAVYQQVMGVEINKVSFRRKIENQGIVVPVPGEKHYGAHRPAQLYRAAERTLMEFDQVI